MKKIHISIGINVLTVIMENLMVPRAVLIRLNMILVQNVNQSCGIDEVD